MKPARTFNVTRVVLPTILLFGFAVRLWWMTAQVPIITVEGSEYVRMAENLVLGHGLIGLWGDPETMYGPLFPFLIAGIAWAVPSAETAAHVVLLVFGTALIAAVFGIARLMYGRRTACLCALLAAAHPLLVKESASIYNETIYMAPLVAAVYFGLRALDQRRRRDIALCGVCFGLAYLARQEAVAYPLFFALAVCIASLTRQRAKEALLASAILVGSFAVVASPYVAYLYKETGSLRLEGKWNINYTGAQRILEGMGLHEARFGIDEDLNVEGPLLEPRRFADYTPYPHAFSDKLHILTANAKRNVWAIYSQFIDDAIGSPVLLVLVILGLFRRPWSRKRQMQEAVVLTMVASIVFLLVTATEVQFRYFFPMLPFLLIWAGKGVDELGEWARTSAVLSNHFLARPTMISVGVQTSAVVLLFGLSVVGTRPIFDSTLQTNADAVAERDAGLWLREHRPGPKRVAAWLSSIPFHSGATMVMWPYADAELTLRYLKSRHVDFAVLESERGRKPPVIDEWIASGIPDADARLIYDTKTPKGGRVLIYSWGPT